MSGIKLTGAFDVLTEGLETLRSFWKRKETEEQRDAEDKAKKHQDSIRNDPPVHPDEL